MISVSARASSSLGTEMGELTSNTGPECGSTDLSVSNDAFEGLVPDEANPTVTWYWLTPTPSA